MVLNAAVQMLREADELKQKILKFKSGTSMLQERSLWVTQQQLQKVYQKVLVLDLDYALEKKVEQDLWNIGFKQQIEALQAISKDRKSPLRSEGQAMLSWVLQAAAGFYLCLLHQICTTFKLDLPFRRRASLLGWVEGWGAGEATGGSRLPPPAAARYICQHCLVHLGDLARYRQQLCVAHTFYRHALVVSVHSGQPYNQLALVAWRRGRRLAALYWHVRSLLVRAPFPPAPANLARTLHAAASGGLSSLPVLPGVTPGRATPAAAGGGGGGRLHAQAYVSCLVRALHMIHSVDQLETAESLVDCLNSSLTSLIATDSFESMMLIKMTCVLIWIVHSSNEDFKLESNALSEGEAKAAQLSEKLATSAILALLLPAYTLEAPPERALPALKVWLQWCVYHQMFVKSSAWRARPALWPALAHTLNKLADVPPHSQTPMENYETVPLPEDEELHGFLPLEEALKPLRFANHAAWDTYGGRVPNVPDDRPDDEPPSEVSTTCLSNEPELEKKVRAHRLLQLGRRLGQLFPEHLQCTDEDGPPHFTATSVSGEQLSAVLAELAVAATMGGEGGAGALEGDAEGEDESDDEPDRPPPPIVISEADFREKVREKRVGILKPQGSLERAREERAMANTQDDAESDGGEETSKGDDKKEFRKPRVNIAMAAIMRKQEETNKQVKFVTPPPTPDSTGDSNEAKDQDKPKVIQPKAIKNLASLPLGRKTGGILSLKDKSAGYPHLQNIDTEPPKKTDKEDKKELKSNQGSSQNSQQSYQPKRQDIPPPSWSPSMPPPNVYNDGPRMNFQKNYGIQNAGITYSPNYPSPPNVNNQGIRLPVVNPKEIDVRTAALQKQNSRQELFQDGHKFGNYNYQMSGDKKNFLNDLPPRFANQYRYWQTAQENQFNDNKFRDDSFKQNSLFNSQPSNWGNTPQQQDNYTQPMPWWKPENQPPSFNNSPNYSQSIQPNFYSPHAAPNLSNPYQNMSSFNQMQNQSVGQQKPENILSSPNYVPSSIGQPQLQTLQNIVSSPNFNSSLNNFGTYAPTVGYDSSMYPQFNNNKLGYQPMQMKMMDKPALPGYQTNKDLMDIGGLGFGSNAMDMQQRNLGMKFNDSMSSDNGGMKNMDQIVQRNLGMKFNDSLSNDNGGLKNIDQIVQKNLGLKFNDSLSSDKGGMKNIDQIVQRNLGLKFNDSLSSDNGGMKNIDQIVQRNLGMKFNDSLSDNGGMKNIDQIVQMDLGMKFNDSMSSDSDSDVMKKMEQNLSGSSAGEVGSTYSLFSGASDAPAWGAAHQHPQQSLWSGPGPSPLERLLEQQKQLKQPPAPH